MVELPACFRQDGSALLVWFGLELLAGLDLAGLEFRASPVARSADLAGSVLWVWYRAWSVGPDLADLEFPACPAGQPEVLADPVLTVCRGRVLTVGLVDQGFQVYRVVQTADLVDLACWVSQAAPAADDSAALVSAWVLLAGLVRRA